MLAGQTGYCSNRILVKLDTSKTGQTITGTGPGPAYPPSPPPYTHTPHPTPTPNPARNIFVPPSLPSGEPGESARGASEGKSARGAAEGEGDLGRGAEGHGEHHHIPLREAGRAGTERLEGFERL